MTFDLGVWKGGSGLSATAASFIYSGLCQGERSGQLLAARDDVAAFYAELTSTWPEVKTSKIQTNIDSPWAGPLLRAENYVLLSCNWQHADIVLAYVTALSGKHGLTVFDPQSEEIYLPDAGLQE